MTIFIAIEATPPYARLMIHQLNSYSCEVMQGMHIHQPEMPFTSMTVHLLANLQQNLHIQMHTLQKFNVHDSGRLHYDLLPHTIYRAFSPSPNAYIIPLHPSVHRRSMSWHPLCKICIHMYIQMQPLLTLDSVGISACRCSFGSDCNFRCVWTSRLACPGTRLTCIAHAT